MSGRLLMELSGKRYDISPLFAILAGARGPVNAT
ncbi:hypothetical protein PPL19_06921 [Pseudomonas psychrotolerans L19]|nr:hypothetical protein PPL19_06921 [Pseudomonas psychrotolerans L19]